MLKVSIIFRCKTNSFNSIENVFGTLNKYLKASSLELPFESNRPLNLIKNILFIRSKKLSIIHISGHDHYLLWFPFRNAILTIHDIEALKRKKGLKRMIFKYLWFTLPIKNAKIITTISEFSKNEIQGLYKKTIPIRVIENPLTLNLDFCKSTFNEECPKLLLIGTKQNKNLERVIQAVIGLQCELIIIGKLKEETLVSLTENKIRHTAMFNISKKEIEEQYNVCDLLCFVSTYEGFGLPILEAQAAGRPILCSNVSPMKEVAGDGALLADPFSIEDIRNGIISIIEDKKLRLSLVEKGRLNVKKYDPEIIAIKYQSIYSELGSKS